MNSQYNKSSPTQFAESNPSLNCVLYAFIPSLNVNSESNKSGLESDSSATQSPSNRITVFTKLQHIFLKIHCDNPETMHANAINE